MRTGLSGGADFRLLGYLKVMIDEDRVKPSYLLSRSGYNISVAAEGVYRERSFGFGWHGEK